MNRRLKSSHEWLRIATFVAILLLAALLVAEGQEAGKAARIGVLHSIPPDTAFQAFRKGLQELGYVEGRNVQLEYRWPKGGLEDIPALAAQVVQSKVDVILVISSGVARAAKRATDTVPIVFCAVGEDPVQRGWISSFARPGGNATGTVTLAVELEAKRLELLKEAVPGLSRAAVLWNPSAPVHQDAMRDVDAAARRLNVRVIPVEWKGPGDIDRAFQLASRERADGVLVLTSPEIMLAREKIAQVALKHRLPTAGMEMGFAEAGNLLQYGPDRAESCRRAASYVDRIVKGAKPADLPIEQATKFELIVNLKTAKRLGLMISPSVLGRADQVIIE
jgi:putative tryptophan/tyrosine transport system substrate-binding protein